MKLFATLVLAGPMTLSAGQYQVAEFVAGGNPNQGQCRIEVIVDGVAEIKIRANMATFLGLSGQLSRLHRYQCNGVMPINPLNFHFVGVDGRGRQDLIQSPRNGEAAVVHIKDTGPGSSAYTFDLMWDYVLLTGPQSRGSRLDRSHPSYR